jgi:hypothetical protein
MAHALLQTNPCNLGFYLQGGPWSVGEEQSLARRQCSGEDRPRRWGLGGEKARGKPCAPFGARNRGRGGREAARRR